MRVAAVVLAAAFIGACTRAGAPEAEVRATLARAEQAAAAKDVAVLRDLLAADYRDGEGRDRRAVEQLLRVYFLRHGSIHLLTRVTSLRFPSPTQAEVVVLVAMAGTPIAPGADLAGLAADVQRLDLTLVREGGAWRATRATWQRAEPGALL